MTHEQINWCSSATVWKMLPGVSSRVKSLDNALKRPRFFLKKTHAHAAVTLDPLPARMHRATCCNRSAAAA